jgi:hypothetical protein
MLKKGRKRESEGKGGRKREREHQDSAESPS